MATNSEIKRKVELRLCALLSVAVPGTAFLPAKGGDDTNDATVILPPYCVVDATDSEKRIPSEPTFQVEVSVTYVTAIDDTPTPTHSATVRAIFDALSNLPRGFDPVQALILHGSDITGTDEVHDTERQSHGDVILLTLGASG